RTDAAPCNTAGDRRELGGPVCAERCHHRRFSNDRNRPTADRRLLGTTQPGQPGSPALRKPSIICWRSASSLNGSRLIYLSIERAGARRRASATLLCASASALACA